MKKTIYSLLVIALGITSCDKGHTEIKGIEPELPVEATMTRTLDFTILGTEKDTTYTNKTSIKATARFGDDAILMGSEKNVFIMSVDAGPSVSADGAGDFVQFVIDRTKLKAGYVGTYRFDTPSELPIKHVRYAYVSNKVSGAYSANLAGSNMGNAMTGELTITQYDAVKNTIRGTYTVTGKLYFDPTDFSRVTKLDDECDLRVTGAFKNVKVTQD